MKRLSLMTLLLVALPSAAFAQDPSLTGGGSATGIDLYGTGLYDFLQVAIGINVPTSSYYSYSVKLEDKNGTVLGEVSSFQFLASPTANLYFYFDGTVIGQNGIDGPYYLKDLTLQNMFGAGSLSAALAYTTPPFRADQFPGFHGVVDTTPPTVAVVADPDVLWPVNHKMHEITINVIATDDVDPNPVVTFESVTSNQGENLTADGNTSPDILVQDGHIFLRAERSGMTKDDRVYTITYSARDASGNVGFGAATVTVPHDQGQK